MAEDENFRKIFVGGLHYNTNEDGLRSYFQQWGEVTGVTIMKDHTTQRSRGFGFVTFGSSAILEECLRSRPHIIETKEVECKRAIPREGMQQPLPELHVTSKKPVIKARKFTDTIWRQTAGPQEWQLFVGSIKEEMTEDHLREYFSHYGTVASVDITVDRNTGKRRGFAFVTFDDYDPVDKIILEGSHYILEQPIAVKKALEREQKEMIAAGGTVRGRGRGAAAPCGAAGAPPMRGGRGGRGGGPTGPPTGGYYNGGGYGAPGGYPGGYGGGGGGYGGYSDGWGQQGGGWGGPPGPGAWNPGGGYGGPEGYGGNFGSGYGGGYGGGAMKGPGYGQRATGPYGGGFGRGGAPGYGGGPPGNPQGGWDAKPDTKPYPQAGGYGAPGGGYGGGYGQH